MLDKQVYAQKRIVLNPGVEEACDGRLGGGSTVLGEGEGEGEGGG